MLQARINTGFSSSSSSLSGLAQSEFYHFSSDFISQTTQPIFQYHNLFSFRLISSACFEMGYKLG
jgi:hypothetical protein